MKREPVKIFLDANIVIQAGKPPGGPLFQRVVDLVRADFVDVLTTDLTKTEIAKKHVENDYDVIKELGAVQFRKIAQAALGIDLPELAKPEIENALVKKYSSEVEDMFAALKAKILSIDSIRPSAVFDAYATRQGFFSGEGKRHQFPDAFIFECLKGEASEETPITIVSNDGDFTGPADRANHMALVRSIPELFKILDLEFEAPAVESFLQAQHGHLVEMVDSELGNWGLNASDVEGAEIYATKVTNVEFLETTSFGRVDKEGDVLVVGTMQVTATVSFSHPDWDNAIYDSEDKTLHAFDSVSGETEVTLDVEFSMSILVNEDDGKLEDIDRFSFTDENYSWNWIDLHHSDLDY